MFGSSPVKLGSWGALVLAKERRSTRYVVGRDADGKVVVAGLGAEDMPRFALVLSKENAEQLSADLRAVLTRSVDSRAE